MKDFEFDFEKLTVYKKALDLIDQVFEVYKTLSSDFKICIGSNLVRAALSIANNLAEGNGKRSKKERNRYFNTSLDSTRECISVFNVLLRQHLIDNSRYVSLRFLGKEITSMIWV